MTLKERIEQLIADRRTTVLVLVLVFALAVRLAAVFTSGREGALEGDEMSYDLYAKEIVAGDWVGRQVSYREVGFPLLVSVIYRIAGPNPAAVHVANAIIGAVTVLLVFVLAEKLFGGAVALLSALWSSIYFHFIFYTTFVLRESLVTFLLVLCLLLFLLVVRRAGWLIVAAALCFVALIHTDARYIFYTPFVLLYFCLASPTWRAGLRRGVLFGLVFVVAMIPWQYRNYQVYGRFVLVNTRTLSLYLPWQERAPAPKKPDTGRGQTGEVRDLRGFRRKAYDFTELYRLFRFRGEVRAGSTRWEKPWSTQHNVSSILLYGPLIPLFIYGMWCVARRRRREAYVLLMPVVAHTVLHLIQWGRTRYRVPIEPAIIILAFFGLQQLATWTRTRRTADG